MEKIRKENDIIFISNYDIEILNANAKKWWKLLLLTIYFDKFWNF